VTQAQLIAINGESSFWPRCDNSQQIKGSASGYTFGLYCSREWTNELNNMLKELGYCGDRQLIRKFLAQVAYETGYYSTLGQPIDDGSGIIHMIPSNWDANVDDMEAVFPGQGLRAEYRQRSANDKKNFFKEPAYAWKSAAAWFKKTGTETPGCSNLLRAKFKTQTTAYAMTMLAAFSMLLRTISTANTIINIGMKTPIMLPINSLSNTTKHKRKIWKYQQGNLSFTDCGVSTPIIVGNSMAKKGSS